MVRAPSCQEAVNSGHSARSASRRRSRATGPRPRAPSPNRRTTWQPGYFQRIASSIRELAARADARHASLKVIDDLRDDAQCSHKSRGQPVQADRPPVVGLSAGRSGDARAGIHAGRLLRRRACAGATRQHAAGRSERTAAGDPAHLRRGVPRGAERARTAARLRHRRWRATGRPHRADLARSTGVAGRGRPAGRPAPCAAEELASGPLTQPHRSFALPALGQPPVPLARQPGRRARGSGPAGSPA